MGKDGSTGMSIEDLKQKQAAEGSAAQAPTDQQRRLTLREAIEAFNRREAQTVPGAPSRGLKEDLLRADEAQEANPDAHLRFVSPQKAQQRLSEGYVVVSEAEGGKRLGNELILMGMPKGLHQERVAEIERRTQELLVAHVGEMQQTAEAVARTLRDHHGLRVSAEDLMKP